MNSTVRVLLYWILLAPILFTVIAEVVVLPSGLLARVFYEPSNQPAWLKAALVGEGVLAYAISGYFVWWCWCRFRIPSYTSSESKPVLPGNGL
jgi:hypothetical protein